MFTAEHAFQFNLVHPVPELSDACGHLVLGILITLFDGHFQKHVGIFQVVEILLPGLDHLLELSQLFLNLFGLGLVVPEILRDYQLPQPLSFLLFAG